MREADEKRRERDEEEASPYLRRPRRVEVRRPPIRWRRVLVVGFALLVAMGGAASGVAWGVGLYLSRSPRFALRESPAAAGIAQVMKAEIDSVFAGDGGRSVFDIPLERRRVQLLALPWAENAWVMRGWPNRLRVVVAERKPVAYVRTRNGTPALMDRSGALLPLPRRGQFQYPVLAGVDEATPPEERRKQVERMLAVLEDLDRDTPKRAGEVSEIDLSDPENAAVTVAVAGSAILVHLGDGKYLDRYRYFLQNIGAWQDQFGTVRSVDLKYEKQVIVR